MIPSFETARPEGDPAILLLCDHASNRVPAEIGGGDLGLPAADMQRHIAYAVGPSRGW
jgi:predicted N-formylglutamate amidohydrolase